MNTSSPSQTCPQCEQRWQPPRTVARDPLLNGQGGPYERRTTTGPIMRRTNRPGLFEFRIVKYR